MNKEPVIGRSGVASFTAARHRTQALCGLVRTGFGRTFVWTGSPFLFYYFTENDGEPEMPSASLAGK